MSESRSKSILIGACCVAVATVVGATLQYGRLRRKGRRDGLDFSRFVFVRHLSGNTLLGHFGDPSKLAIVNIKTKSIDRDMSKELVADLELIDTVHHNNEYFTHTADNSQASPGRFVVSTVFPAPQRIINKRLPQEYHMFGETSELYDAVTKPFIDSIPEKNIKWVYNILDGQAEQERILFQDPDPVTGFVLLPDNIWKDGDDLQKMHVLAICNRRELKSLRDLRATDLELLENIRSKSYQALSERFKLQPTQFKAYFHYFPTFFHLHVHFVVDFHHPGSTSGLAHLLETVIDNLKAESPGAPHYARARLWLRVGTRRNRDFLEFAKSHGRVLNSDADEDDEAKSAELSRDDAIVEDKAADERMEECLKFLRGLGGSEEATL